MERLFTRTKKILFQSQKDILSSAIILSMMIAVSRVFGFIRYRTLASYFVKEELDIFFTAFRLPDIVFEMLITGALSSAFIPIFIKYKKNPEILSENISSIINFIMIGMLIIGSFIFIFAEPIMTIIAPGYSPDQIQNVVALSRILIVSQLPFLVMGNIVLGIAQAHKIFIITAIAPIVYNIGIIIGTIFLSKPFWIFGPAIGVVAGALLFFVIQLPVVHFVGFDYRIRFFKKDILREFITLFIPRVLSVLTNQIDLTIDLMLSTLLGPGSYTVFFFSQHLSLFPVSLVGMAFGQASLPYISSLYKDNKIDVIKKLFVNSILQLFYLSIPLSFFFIFARTPIVRIVFGGRKFDWAGTNLTAITLSLFALSIPFHTIFYFITRSFYATHDTKTPFIINFASVLINVVLSYTFIIIYKMPVWSLALSFSVAITLNVIFLMAAYYKKLNGFNLSKLFRNSLKIYIASLLSALGPYFTLKLLDKFILDTARTINVFFLLCIVFVLFGASYLFFSWLFTIEEVYVLGKLIVKVRAFKRKLEEFYAQPG